MTTSPRKFPFSRRHKYNVSAPSERTVDGIVFSSKKEAKRYKDLVLAQSQGEVLFFLRQVPFHLPGGIRYVVDFQVHWKDGRVTHEDVKGFKTDVYKLKKRLVEATYPVKIVET